MGSRYESISPRIEQFLHEYVKDFNGADALRRCGSKAKRPQVEASRILASPVVKARMAELIAPKRPDIKVTVERVLTELSRIGFCDPADFFKTVKVRGTNGTISERSVLKEMHELTEDQRRALTFELGTEGVKMKQIDKKGALDSMGRYLKMFTDLHEVSHTFNALPPITLNGKAITFNVGEKKK